MKRRTFLTTSLAIAAVASAPLPAMGLSSRYEQKWIVRVDFLKSEFDTSRDEEMPSFWYSWDHDIAFTSGGRRLPLFPQQYTINDAWKEMVTLVNSQGPRGQRNLKVSSRHNGYPCYYMFLGPHSCQLGFEEIKRLHADFQEQQTKFRLQTLVDLIFNNGGASFIVSIMPYSEYTGPRREE